MMTLKERVSRLLEVSEEDHRGSRIVDAALVLLISINVIAVVAETVQPFAGRHALALHWIEIISIIIFSVEYLLRLWSCTALPSGIIAAGFFAEQKPRATSYCPHCGEKLDQTR